MAISDPKDTLAYHASRVLTTSRDMSHIGVSSVSAKINEYMGAHSKDTQPEAEALWFYGMNHGMALIQQAYAPLEPLPAAELQFVKDYHKSVGEKAVRAFYYMLIICVREARHNKSLGKDKSKLAQKFNASLADFHANHAGEDGIHKALLNTPPACTMGQLCDSLRWVYYNSSWNGGYGGKKWGAVADCLGRFVNGEFTGEMMMDTVWTLAHNNGPIFNKGHLYTMYGPQLIALLDVQRSGQIPEWVLGKHGFHDPELANKMQWLKSRFPDKIRDYIDWYVVEALGSVHKYASEKKAQIAKYGMSPFAGAAEKAAAAAAIAKAQARKEKKLAHAKSHLVIGVKPGGALEEVKKFTRAA